MRSRCALLLCLLFLSISFFEDEVILPNSSTQISPTPVTSSGLQDSPFASLSALLTIEDKDKKAICATAKRLYERATREKKPVTWEQIFEFLLTNFYNGQNNFRIRKELIDQAKVYCPTYKKAVEVLNEQL